MVSEDGRQCGRKRVDLVCLVFEVSCPVFNKHFSKLLDLDFLLLWKSWCYQWSVDDTLENPNLQGVAWA
jgi:hypothetical protein